VTGLTLAALSVCSAVCGPLGGRWSDARGIRTPALVGAGAIWTGAAGLVGAVYEARLWPVIISLAAMGLGIGLSGAPVQTAAVEAVPGTATGAAAGIYSTSRYLGSVLGSTVLAILFATEPDAGEIDRFVVLFVGLAVAAFGGIVINALLGGHGVDTEA
jgi:MFS family permease